MRTSVFQGLKKRGRIWKRRSAFFMRIRRGPPVGHFMDGGKTIQQCDNRKPFDVTRTEM